MAPQKSIDPIKLNSEKVKSLTNQKKRWSPFHNNLSKSIHSKKFTKIGLSPPSFESNWHPCPCKEVYTGKKKKLRIKKRREIDDHFGTINRQIIKNNGLL